MAGIAKGSFMAAGMSLAATSPVAGALLGTAVAPPILGTVFGGLGVAGLGLAGWGFAASQSWHVEDPPTPDHPYFIAVHDYGTVRVTSHDTYEEAEADWVSRIGSPLRRIFFQLGPRSSPNDRDRPWIEHKHDGDAPWVDDGMRDALQATLA